MNTIVIILAIATLFSTLIGGLVVLRFRKLLPYFFAFSAGSLMGVVFLDILPESIKISESISFPLRYIFLIVVASFFAYSLLERIFLTHNLEHEDSHGHIMGPIGAGSLILHSFLDGAAIGTAFHVSASMGIIIALAVISHDFTDGINTVNLMLKNKQKTGNTVLFLIFDALAPVLGIITASFIFFSQKALVIILAIFVGEFLYIGASTLIPETKKHPSWKMAISIALGMLLIAILTSFL